MIETNKIYCSDCVKLMKQMDKECVDLTVTQPPAYSKNKYKGHFFSVNLIAKELYRVTKKGGVVVWVTNDKFINGSRSLNSFKEAESFKKAGFKIHDVMIYRKKNPPFARDDAYTNAFEYMFVFSKGTPKTFNPLQEKTANNKTETFFEESTNDLAISEFGYLGETKNRSNIWEYAVGFNGSTSDKEAFLHPSIFPENLALDHILSWSNPDELVFDPMCGSGTTCKMAVLSGRNYLGCDRSRKFVNITLSRLGIFAN